MPTVVVIHAAEDTLPARALAEKLRQTKLQVVLEKDPGADLREAIKTAPAVIALWSPRSVAQEALIDDANFARGKTKVFHACMQSAPAPAQFSGDQSVNLTGWRGEDDFPAWRELAQLVTAKVGVAPLPPPAPKPASGFFQPGAVNAAARQAAGGAPARPAPPPRPAQAAAPPRAAPPPPRPQPAAPAARRPAPPAAPRADEPERKSGGMMIAIIAAVAVAVLGGGAFWYLNNSGAQSESAWTQVDGSDPDAIRAFLAGDPGEFREPAEQALAELEERYFEAASDADTIEALEGFLNDFPESEHGIVVRGRIAELRTLQASGPADVGGETLIEPPADPDLLPPSAANATPPPAVEATPPDASGPVTLTPPAEEPAPEPGTDLPTE